MSLILGLLVILTSLSPLNRAESCLKPEISLIQKIENEGFHRELRWLLERAPNPQWDAANCRIALKLQITNGMFISPDEIAELNRLNLLKARIEGRVDIEAVAHIANEHTAYIFINNSEKVAINLPFHLRYQRAQITGGTGKVTVNKPSVLVDCNLVCSKMTVKAPCNLWGDEICQWQNVSYEALFDSVELLVPVGNLDDYPLVSIVTLLLGCAGCIYILSILSMMPL